jgi:hypothetical protein
VKGVDQLGCKLFWVGRAVGCQVEFECEFENVLFVCARSASLTSPQLSLTKHGQSSQNELVGRCWQGERGRDCAHWSMATTAQMLSFAHFNSARHNVMECVCVCACVCVRPFERFHINRETSQWVMKGAIGTAAASSGSMLPPAPADFGGILQQCQPTHSHQSQWSLSSTKITMLPTHPPTNQPVSLVLTAHPWTFKHTITPQSPFSSAALFLIKKSPTRH